MRDVQIPTKLVVVIVSDTDAVQLLNRLVEAGLSATKIGSSGGFLRRGKTIILSGVSDDGVDRVVELVDEVCHPRKEFLYPASARLFLGEGAFPAEPVEVRVGGAVVFVLQIDRFERT